MIVMRLPCPAVSQLPLDSESRALQEHFHFLHGWLLQLAFLMIEVPILVEVVGVVADQAAQLAFDVVGIVQGPWGRNTVETILLVEHRMACLETHDQAAQVESHEGRSAGSEGETGRGIQDEGTAVVAVDAVEGAEPAAEPAAGYFVEVVADEHVEIELVDLSYSLAVRLERLLE